MNETMVIDVARLDGYLNGIVALNGKINEYYAGAFLFKKSSNEKLETSLVNYYAPRCQIYFSNITESNLGEVELEIQDFIAENILGCNMQPFNSKDLFDRKKYISFKIMDMVNFLISNPLDEPGHKVNILVHKVEANLNDTNADFIFFCISFDNNILVLQFKHTAQEIR